MNDLFQRFLLLTVSILAMVGSICGEIVGHEDDQDK